MLWDMDGTLIESEPLWLAAEDAMLDEFGISMSDEDRHSLVGLGLWDAAELFRRLGVPLGADAIVDQWVADVLAGYERFGTAWRPGARRALASLRASGIPCALVTMSVRVLADWVVRELPAGTFQAVIAGDEVTRAKPDPEPYLLGAAGLGVPIEQCVAFEDSPTGLRSAFGSGAVSIGVPNLVDLSEAPAHEIWRTLEGAGATEIRTAFERCRLDSE